MSWLRLTATQTAFCIQIRHIKSIWAHWCSVHGHTVALAQLYPLYLAQILGYVVTCGVKIMSLCHGWGWQPPQTASRVYIRNIQSIWAHWYSVLGHTLAALHSYTQLVFGSDFGFGVVGSHVELKWCHYYYVMVEAGSHLKLLPTSKWDIKKFLTPSIYCS